MFKKYAKYQSFFVLKCFGYIGLNKEAELTSLKTAYTNFRIKSSAHNIFLSCNVSLKNSDLDF